jgi:hypothetical protein
LDAYSLSKTLHLNGTYSWYTFAENILNTNEITEKNIEVTDFNKVFKKKIQLVPGSPEKECLSPMLLIQHMWC